MNININISVTERGYAFGDDPEGKRQIETIIDDISALTVTKGIASTIEPLLVEAISDYVQATKKHQSEGESEP